MRDPWTTTLCQLESKYLQYQKFVDEGGPSIVAKVRRVNLSWRVRIEEDWNDSNSYYYYTFDDRKLDSRCQWAEEQLKKWQCVTRLSDREWKFFSKRQAEKFLTLFNLRWAQ